MGSEEMHVLFLADEWGSSKGGISTINREMAKHFALLPNVNVSCLVPPEQDRGVKEDVLKYHGVHLVETKKYHGFDPPMLLCFPPDNLEKIDVVIGHGRKLGRQAQPIRDSRKCKWVQFVHVAAEDLGNYKGIRENEPKHATEISLCKEADLVVAIGSKLQETYNRGLTHCEKSAEVFIPGVFEEFRTTKHAKVDWETFGILVFGRGSSEDFELKGYDIAAAAVKGMDPEKYHLIFVGASEGEQENVMKKLLEHGIQKNQLTVRSFCKSRDQLKSMFSEADVAIMPSRTEGFGLTALEALSAGVPVLVTRNSGFGKALKNVPYGDSYIVDSEEPEEWKKRIQLVLGKKRAQRLEEAATLRDRYADTYSWQDECARIIEKIRSLFCQ